MQNTEQDNKARELCQEINKFPRMFDWVDRWAKERPNDVALIEYNTGEKVTWKEFSTNSKAFAAKLLKMGVKKGDVVATMLVLLKEHVYLMYACHRIGAIIAPLDPRLKKEEINVCFEKMKPKAFFCLGNTPTIDFRPIISEMAEKYGVKNGGPCRHFIQFQKEADQIVDGAQGILDFAKDVKISFIKSLVTGSLRRAQKKVDKRDPILIIFTTGSTGSPKPALICSENILIQNIGLSAAFDVSQDDIMLVNLPPCHVGCVTEQLDTTIFNGGTSVLLHIFNPEESLDAVQKYKVTVLGQIPALYSMEWNLPNYKEYDLSSLKFALYGGQSVSKKFLENLSEMAPKFGSGLGLTETAGFCSYSPLDGTVDDILASIGFDMPFCPISIREPLKDDGFAGDEMEKGKIGEICYSGPQIFLGYLNDDENTRKTISKEGILYTGDLGYYDEKGLHFAGRSKFMIKPKGNNVFPTEVEEFISGQLKSKVNQVAVIGVEHELFTEAVMAFVEKKDGEALTAEEVMAASRGMAGYKRPSHVVIMNEGDIPINRIAKTDYLALQDQAKEINNELRKTGGWDRGR